MTRRLSSILVFALVLAACTAGSSATTSTGAPQTTGDVEETTTTTVAQTTTSTLPEPTWSELPGIDSLPQAVQDELLQLVRATEELRGLRFLEPPMITLVSDSELESRVRQQIDEQTADFPADEALYKLLGLLDNDIDLASLLSDLYGEQVAGFYDGETGELVVPIREDGFSVVQRATLVHELTHALTDQHFRFYPMLQDMFDQDRLDQGSAYQALVEGDASMAELLYVQGLTQRELGEFVAEALDVDSSTLEAAPPFIRDSLLFPYDSGLAWVQSYYTAEDGWSAINDAYTEFPGLPASTEQIITPSDYERDLPLTIDIPSPELPGYTLEHESTWGELGFRLMLDQVLGESTGVKAADGWGGDTYDQWYDGRNAALLIVARGDTARDTEELRAAMLDYAKTAVPDEDWVWVEVFGDRLVFIAADETTVGETLLAQFQG